jgi:vancomycin resistance protein YoaR
MKKFLFVALAVAVAQNAYAQNARDDFHTLENAATAIARPVFPGRFGRVSVAGVSIAKLNREEAMRRLKRELAPKLDANIALTDGRIYFKRKRRDFGIELDLGKMLARAERGDSYVPLALRLDEKQLTAVLRRIAPRFGLESRAAKPFYFNGKVQIQKEIPWQRVNIGASVPRAAVQIQQNAGTRALELTMRRNTPALTAARLKGINAVIGTFTTRFNPGIRGRTVNLKKGVAAIDGTLLSNGETFSLNKTVGERTRARGYQEAIIFEDGKKKKDLGGGISQVTGTLFNAALEAGLPIVSYRTHSRPVAYIPIGRDATVAWGQFDMKFRNNTGAPIYISYQVRGSRMTATLFGKGPAPRTSINVVSRTLGEREKKAQLFRVVRKNGKVVSRERVGTSHYKWKEDDPELD